MFIIRIIFSICGWTKSSFHPDSVGTFAIIVLTNVAVFTNPPRPRPAPGLIIRLTGAGAGAGRGIVCVPGRSIIGIKTGALQISPWLLSINCKNPYSAGLARTQVQSAEACQ